MGNIGVEIGQISYDQCCGDSANNSSQAENEAETSLRTNNSAQNRDIDGVIDKITDQQTMMNRSKHAKRGQSGAASFMDIIV